MNPKLQGLLPLIEKRLLNNDIIEFKIGVTEQEIEERFAMYPKGCYGQIGHLASGNTSEILQGEKDLITYFKDNEKCQNIDSGGGGNISNQDKLYIVAQCSQAKSIEDVHRCNIPLFNFKPITL